MSRIDQAFNEFLAWSNGVLAENIDLPIQAILNEATDPRTPHPEDSIFNGLSSAEGVLRSLGYVIDNPESITIKWDGKPALIFGYGTDGKFSVMDKYMYDAGFFAMSPADWLKYDKQKASGRLRADVYPKLENIWDGLKYAAAGTTGYFWGDLLWAEELKPVDGNYIFQPNTVKYTVPVNSDLGKNIRGKRGGVTVHQYFEGPGSKPVQWNGSGLRTNGPVLILTPTLGINFKLKKPGELASRAVRAVGDAAGIDTFISGLDGVAREAIKKYMNHYVTRQTTQNLEDWLQTNVSTKQYKFLTQPSQQTVNGKTLTTPGYLVKNKKQLNQLFNVWNSISALKNNLVGQLEGQVQGLKQSTGGVQGGEGFIFNTPTGLIKLVNRGHFSAANFAKNATKGLTEGGNIFKMADKTPLTRRINQEEVGPTIKWIEGITGLDLTSDKDSNGYPVKWLGSTGRKKDSGDLDLAVSAEEIDKDTLIKKIAAYCTSIGIPADQIYNKKGFSGGWIEKTGISVHFKAPIGGNPDNGFVQVDFMFLENPRWSTWYLSNDPKSNFKGMYRNILINSIAKGAGYKVNQNSGLYDRGTGQLVTDSPEETAKIILNPGASLGDLSSVEAILKAVAGDPNKENKLKDFREYMARDGVDIDRLVDKEKISEAVDSKKYLVIYPGGFHPFHLGHASVYNHLKTEFGGSGDVYVAATDTTKERPFQFQDKKFLAGQNGVPGRMMVQVKSPYRANEITTLYDPDKTVLVFAVSEKDSDRFSFGPKKDGSPSYFKKWHDGASEPMNRHAYVYVTPKIDFKIAGQTIDSASKIRSMYTSGSPEIRDSIIDDLYPNSSNKKKIRGILDSVLGSINEADNPNYFGGSSMSPIPGTPSDLVPGPDKADIVAYRKEMAELKRFLGHK